MSDPHPKSDDAHALEGVPDLPPAWIGALKGRWITTAEQVLATAASTEGRRGLEEALGLGADGMHQLLDRLAQVVGEAKAAQLLQPSAGGALGAMLTDDQKKQFGTK